MFCLLTHLFVFTFHAETHDVRGFFLGVWLLTKVPWTTQPNYLLHRWKLQVCFKKHPSFLSSKHSTSALYFCWLWFVIFYLKPLNQQCCKFRIPNVFRLLFELNKCYQSHLSHILAIFTVALSGCWEDNTLVRNRWSVAGKKTNKHILNIREPETSWLSGALGSCGNAFAILVSACFLKAPWISSKKIRAQMQCNSRLLRRVKTMWVSTSLTLWKLVAPVHVNLAGLVVLMDKICFFPSNR